MALDQFEIGTTHGGLVNIEDLGTPLSPPKSTWDDGPLPVDLATGAVRSGGWTLVTWRWEFLSQVQWTQVQVFCAGRSADVYIVTRKDDGTYQEYTAIMVRPSGPERKNVKVFDVTIEFRNCVEYSP